MRVYGFKKLCDFFSPRGRIKQDAKKEIEKELLEIEIDMEDISCDDDEFPSLKLKEEEKILYEKYKKYVGKYAKRFYAPFEENTIQEIVGAEMSEYGIAFFRVKNKEGEVWIWDIDDCIIVTNDLPIVLNERVISIYDKEYNGYNPFK